MYHNAHRCLPNFATLHLALCYHNQPFGDPNLFPCIVEKFTVDYTTGAKQTFVTVFAVLFNGCTGIMAGANMSGKFRHQIQQLY